MEISGRTGLFALIGTPVGHSKSPLMYNYSFEKLDLDYRYLAFDITVDKVKDALSAIKTFNIKGANVTMPCKTAVTEYMDELSPAARIIGACNTIVNEDGKLIGHITDGVGYVRNLKENGVEVKGKKLTIMGAGGAATAIQVQCALDGAREISIFNAKDDFYKRAEQTIENIKKEVPGCIVNLYDLADTEKLYEEVSSSDILTNATLIGMKPHDNETNIKDVSVLRKELVVTDVVYNPNKTKMIEDAEANGCKAIGGLGMLLYQGAEAFNLYTGLEMPVEEIKELYFK
ncbi:MULTISPECIES: shikimate dehydrogenase [unclassified Clostridioides]|uniref:shikimate dehydrogenase n=1 Tax=unclassified Clostridioides TaxID=2635829 RepID=UPI001D100A9F|nr:shikimate dehydrogenase [Clostridioides sp. ZZV14-6150]MCC0662313.1 shikimate dehydrogenase [Clostridioides sp. ZZV14-6154]MCC0670238.1 shikimate dehydrogenase [Clostridioides sp. ZZV14-6153]MCC0720518.1 shikimate dehydrogenase [Clostridioides sp. ZZV14-6105]MCC0728632.1 shikimate dehydrogenase [Clostridioides sp. ZZV14-6045]MCC0732769.1 shikimate dehydrogenase [Clostridioides sp. ZZV14-6048]MCC0736772.1 shikimate dehydrogenase [Clostridioides sp. ZZV14-6009]MCC0740713.1 shikimate dehydro